MCCLQKSIVVIGLWYLCEIKKTPFNISFEITCVQTTWKFKLELNQDRQKQSKYWETRTRILPSLTFVIKLYNNLQKESNIVKTIKISNSLHLLFSGRQFLRQYCFTYYYTITLLEENFARVFTCTHPHTFSLAYPCASLLISFHKRNPVYTNSYKNTNFAQWKYCNK